MVFRACYFFKLKAGSVGICGAIRVACVWSRDFLSNVISQKTFHEGTKLVAEFLSPPLLGKCGRN